MNFTKFESKLFSLERLYTMSPSQKKILGPKKVLDQKEILGPQKNLGPKQLCA